MHVLILTEWYFPIGGIESFTLGLVQGLSPEIHVTVAISFFGQKTELPKLNSNVKIVDVTNGTFRAVQNLIRENTPDIIHTNHLSSMGIAALLTARQHNIPIVITHHQVPEYRSSPFDMLTSPFIWSYIRLFDRFTSQIIAPSPTVSRLLTQHHIFPVKVISCGTDTALFRSKNSKHLARTKLNLPDKPTLLFVGRFGKDKNLEILLQAIAIIKKDFDFQVILAGPATVRGNASKEIGQLIRTLGLGKQVLIPGFIPAQSQELATYYNAADTFVLPSLFETQSIATLEAMASGLPIIASRSGALPDLVEEGVNGLLFTPLDSLDLAHKLREALSNPEQARKMGKESQKKVQPHNIKQVARQYEEVYKKLSDSK